MPRLMHDRYVAFDDIRGRDLATGEDVRLDALPEERSDQIPPALAELLDDGRDANPRWVALDVRNSAQAAAIARRVAVAGRMRGFVPILVSMYAQFRERLAEDLDERTLLLIGSFAGNPAVSRRVLVDAAARAPRPHVLLTFRTCEPHVRPGCLVREARSAYGASQPHPRAVTIGAPSSDVLRHLERAGRAFEFQRAGRHAAAERLLRDVAGALSRREAWGHAADISVVLSRLLLERGRVAAADKVLDEASRFAQLSGVDSVDVNVRIWQAIARTDAGRLTEAESICRAVLLTAASAASQAWGQAVLSRVLCWQGRIDEARRCFEPRPSESSFEGDPVTAASIGATFIRTLLAAGEAFEAGLAARSLLDRWSGAPDPLARLIVRTAHLRVLAEAGDLHLAQEACASALALAKASHAPWRAVRARLIWYDALRRAGRLSEAAGQLNRVARLRRLAPALVRRAIDLRTAAPADSIDHRIVGSPRSSCSLHCGAELVRLAHEDDDDSLALRRVLERAAGELNAGRIEVISADAGPVTALVSVGAGLPTRIGQRVIESGIVIPADVGSGAREVGVPVRLGTRLVAALVCRWAIDREAPPRHVELLTLTAAIVAPRVEALITNVREASYASASVPELIGVSASIAEVRRAIGRAARAPFSVMLEGESGVGKELAARAIHHLSARRERRFCDVNCAALPEELFESELFGHVKGAFTGAVADKAGLFEDADGGTLFLDEVADLSARGQAKLLRVVQQQEVRRVGETFTRKVDVRLIAAANRDMRAEAAARRFRADLLFRLDVIHLRIPPLRERPEDIPILARHYWRGAAERLGSRASLTHAVLAELARYPWPGNVRELQNVMAALVVAAPPRGRVPASLLPPAISAAAVISTPRLAEAREQFERRCVEVALARAGGSRTRAAAELGLTRQGLLKTMARLGIEAPPR